jgi:hypothetical protein
MHREPFWSQEQTYSCGDTTPCPLGFGDQGHFFQEGSNPYVDKRMVFDPYPQEEHRARREFPWDPAAYPQHYHMYDHKGDRINCDDGKLTPECFKDRTAKPPPLAAGPAPRANEKHDWKT